MKLLLSFSEPLGITWMLLAAILVRHLRERQLRGAILPACAWTVLTAFTCTSLPSTLLSSLESQYPPVAAAELPVCDAIVCLGGGASPSPPEPGGIHLKNAADRLTATVILAKDRKAPQIVLGGGGYKVHGKWAAEADILKERLGSMLGEDIHLTSLGLCADTHDEALKTARIARSEHWKRILLVTSAYHLPRAVATFEHQGLQVIPVPCNYITAKFLGSDTDTIHPPNHRDLETFSLWIHEVLGSLFYRWKDWI